MPKRGTIQKAEASKSATDLDKYLDRGFGDAYSVAMVDENDVNCRTVDPVVEGSSPFGLAVKNPGKLTFSGVFSCLFPNN